MERITILGMGPLGVSIGLGLKRARLKDTEILGTDGDSRALKRAREMGAIDTANGNLRSSIYGASLVIMDTPHSETREFLEAIGPIVGQDTIVTDTGSAKMQVAEWARQYLPHDASYVGGRPLPRRTMYTLDDVRPDALDGAAYCVVAESMVSPTAVRTVTGLVEAIGAKPVFLSPEEHDSYAAATAHLPIALAAALVTAVSASPGWRDIAKVVGPEFSDVSRLAALDPEDNAVAFDGNRDALVHWLDRLIEELGGYRDQMRPYSPRDAILESLQRLIDELADQRGRARDKARSDGEWATMVDWLDRVIADLSAYRTEARGFEQFGDQAPDGGEEIMETLIYGWEQLARLESGDATREESFGPPGPTMGQAIGGMLIGRRLADRTKRMLERDEHAPWRYPRRRHG